MPLRIVMPEGEVSIRFWDDHNIDPTLPSILLHQVLRELIPIEIYLQDFQGAYPLTVPFLISFLYMGHTNDPIMCLVRVSDPLLYIVHLGLLLQFAIVWSIASHLRHRSLPGLIVHLFDICPISWHLKYLTTLGRTRIVAIMRPVLIFMCISLSVIEDAGITAIAVCYLNDLTSISLVSLIINPLTVSKYLTDLVKKDLVKKFIWCKGRKQSFTELSKALSMAKSHIAIFKFW